MKNKSGSQLIAAERGRQLRRKGYSANHDDIHTAGELAAAAAVYASTLRFRLAIFRLLWPGWNYRPAKDDTERIDELVKAGALIAAEIDRLRRARKSPLDAP